MLEKLRDPPSLVPLPSQASFHEIKKPWIGNWLISYLMVWIRYNFELGPKCFVRRKRGSSIHHLVEDAAEGPNI
jgi:hypothetical protein